MGGRARSREVAGDQPLVCDAHRHDEERPARRKDVEHLHEAQPRDESEEGLARRHKPRHGGERREGLRAAREQQQQQQQAEQRVEHIKGRRGEVAPHAIAALHRDAHLNGLRPKPAEEVDE